MQSNASIFEWNNAVRLFLFLKLHLKCKSLHTPSENTHAYFPRPSLSAVKSDQTSLV